jgi:AcrR family transcriptional regulator
VTGQARATRDRSEGLRERNKAKRRSAIVDSTLALLREHAIAEVSIERIAARAEVSPATVYNLVGSKEQLLLACIDRIIDRLVDDLVEIDPADDPVRTALAIVERSAEAFIADRHAYRQIVGALGDFSRTGSMMSIDPAQLQIAAMREARRLGLLRDDIDPAAAGRQIYLSYNGALFGWAGLGLTDDGLRLAVQHGLWTALAAYGTDTLRADALDRLRELGPWLTAAGWGNG